MFVEIACVIFEYLELIREHSKYCQPKFAKSSNFLLSSSSTDNFYLSFILSCSNLMILSFKSTMINLNDNTELPNKSKILDILDPYFECGSGWQVFCRIHPDPQNWLLVHHKTKAIFVNAVEYRRNSAPEQNPLPHTINKYRTHIFYQRLGDCIPVQNTFWVTVTKQFLPALVSTYFV